MDRRIKKTNTAIFSAYLALKKEHPETEPSVKEICAKADINKTTFYRYFTDIESLSHSLTEKAINNFLIENLDVTTLLTDPENYFRQVLKRLESFEENLNYLMYGNPMTFIYEAERIIKSKLKETINEKYDEILCTFIAGGAAHYFLSENYDDEEHLKKLCRIIKIATSAI